MIDIDGDCMSDLFLTVQDASSGLKYYEIWIRRETQTVLDLTTNQITKPRQTEDGSIPKDLLTGLQSFCLVSREEIPSGIRNLF